MENGLVDQLVNGGHGIGLLLVGLVFLAGLAADIVGRRTGLPRVTLLILTGIIAGPHGIALLPHIDERTLTLLSTVTLAFVSFLLGAVFSAENLRRHAREILVLSGAVTVLTALVVGIGCALAGYGAAAALALAGIATATDPIATQDVVREAGRRTPFGDRLLSIVAIDDAWGILSFSILIAVAAAVTQSGVDASVVHGLVEIFGAVGLGCALAVPMVLTTGRIKAGEPTQAEALGFVLICAGAAEWLNVSTLLSAMVMGAMTANFARHHSRPFHAIEGIEWPLLIMFFVLTGAAVRVAEPAAVAVLTALYCAARVVGRWAGGYLGSALVGYRHPDRNWCGVALLPQAGVALGMALVANQKFPELGAEFLSAVAIATVIFELLGPVLTRLALKRVNGSAPAAP